MPVETHGLIQGLPLCLFTNELPNAWPSGHTYVQVTVENLSKITCVNCQPIAKDIIARRVHHSFRQVQRPR